MLNHKNKHSETYRTCFTQGFVHYTDQQNGSRVLFAPTQCLYSTEIQKSQPYFLLGRFSFDLTFAVCLLGITLGVNIVRT